MITVASGVQTRVSKTAYGATVPNRMITIGIVASVAARLVASAVAMRSTVNRRMCVGWVSSAGKMRARSGVARNRRPRTAAKLSWNPGSSAVEGAATSARIAAAARIAPEFQSRRASPPTTPMTDMDAARIALAVGASKQSAASITMSTTMSCVRVDRKHTRAIHPAIAPSTTRLNPLTARMCESPTT